MANDLQRAALTAEQQEWVQRVRDGILETVDEFVPASDASRIERDLDTLIDFLAKKAAT